MEKILKGLYFIIGASGNVGREVLKNLLSRGACVRVGTHNSKLIKDEKNIEYTTFDFNDSSTWDSCLIKVTKVFLIRPPHISNIKRDMYPFIKHMKNYDIKQVIFLSVQKAETNALIPHHKVEQIIKKLSIPYTFVRPSFFMQNLTTTHLKEIRDYNKLYIPAGKGKTNFIDVQDIGELIATLFTNPKHINKAYTVTGTKSFSYQEVANCLSNELGREIVYSDSTFFEFILFHKRNSRKLGMILIMFILYSVIKSNHGDCTTSTLKILLEREPHSLESFIHENKKLFITDTK